ncbi:DEAD/DEAH box helicase [Dermatobacter hominis]|uniref:DEAD/DEAH box helicase n=1 Tax=Dermatobacter hominis TaxID=2884263 RepID=UPI001D0FEF75|nr:DEAD/DEAH box helicase [Dermatobacter hominis]UDY37603.1 DEAD/DEAH box helicase [Dermatobacter hominis]
MPDISPALEAAVWAAADGSATQDQLALLEADRDQWLDALELLLDDAEDQLHSARQISGPERAQVVADFESELAQLEASYDLVFDMDDPVAAIAAADPAGEIRLQASWVKGLIVVWAAGPGTVPESADALSDRLEAIGGPALGWQPHRDVSLPGGLNAAALSIPVGEALGWLVAVGGGLGREGVGASVAWLGRVALDTVSLVARGAVVPTLSGAKRRGDTTDMAVTWRPALVDESAIASMAEAMPRQVTAVSQADPRNVTRAVQGAVVEAIVNQAAGMLDFAAPPPQVRTAADVADAFATRLDGSTFTAPVAASAELAERIDRWAKPLTTTARVRLVVTLDPPDSSDAWFVSVLGPGSTGELMPVEQALAEGKGTAAVAGELARLERVFPALTRAGDSRRGQVYLSQDEAWELMTVLGPQLSAAGFEVRVPALSRRKPSPSLRLFTESMGGDTVVGAHQLSNVRWSVVFDDVELTAEDIARLAKEARPLVRSHGHWVELDQVDLKEAAAALAERADETQMTGAEILRHSIGLEGELLGGALTVDGTGWASELFERASRISTDPVTRPEGFTGELRSYQAEALAWLGFLHTVELGGCLALDPGLGKTPTMLAHLARTAGDGTALVVAPPAVVGNWAAEAAKFTPGLRVHIHHGSNRASGAEMDRAFDAADLVITTYGTAVRDMDALSARHFTQVVLDEAQAIKNHTSEQAQQLRRLDAGTRVALTGTPIENGLGDLWAILDFTNPGLVGGRTGFISQMSGEGEAALRALNGILVFRRTKSEPEVAAELPDRIDELDHCMMTPEQVGLYQAVLDSLVADVSEVGGGEPKQGAILAAITALKQICNHPAAYQPDDRPLAGRSGKLERLEEIVDAVFAADEKVLIFTHFATWGKKMADHLSELTGHPIDCYHGGLARTARDKMIAEFQGRPGAGALVLSLKAGGTGLNLTSANHVVLYDRWWNPAVEDQARDRAWRLGQTRTVVSHRLVCPGTVDERVEEVVAGKRHIADLVLPGSSSLADLDTDQLRLALGLRDDQLLTEDDA